MTLLAFMKAAGVSLVGLLLGIAAGMVLVVATALLVGRSFSLSREHTEQARITEDARVQMERLSDAIRDARSVDVTGDGLATFPVEVWLQQGGDFDIEFYTNFDTDSELERLHYFLDGAELRRGLKDPYDSEEEKVTTVARSLRNVGQGKPLFTYYAQDSDVPLPAPVAVPGEVERVEIMLSIDVDEGQLPAAAEVSTVVAPRAADVVLSVSPGPSPTSSPFPTP